MRGLDLSAGQVGDQLIHALRHLGLEHRVVGCLDEEDRLVDNFLREQRLVFFPVREALAVPIY
jgi:hypothetical protein